MSPAHAEEMLDLVGDRRLYAYYDDEPSPSLEELRARYARQATGVSPDGREVWHTWIVRERATGTAIGFVQATVRPEAAELAWVIGVPWQGRGYAGESALAIRDAVVAGSGAAHAGHSTGERAVVVIAHIAPGHAASEAVARHLGLLPTTVVHEGETRWQSPSARTWGR